jgi:hypothetical protein
MVVDSCTIFAPCRLGIDCRLCKLAPEVQQVLDDNNIHFIVSLAAPPNCVTASLIQHIEGGLWLASLGGNEGRYPGTDHEELMRFAREVGVRFVFRVSFRSYSLLREQLHCQLNSQVKWLCQSLKGVGPGADPAAGLPAYSAR